MLATQRFWISKSEGPLSSWKFAGFKLGEPYEPAESVSIDLAHVCAIGIWKPLLKRRSSFIFRPWKFDLPACDEYSIWPRRGKRVATPGVTSYSTPGVTF